MGPKPVVKAPVKAAPVVKKAAPKVVTKPAPKSAPVVEKPKKEKKSKKDKKDVVDTGKEQLDAGLAAGKAQIDAGMAALGSVAANASDAFQGWWGGINVPSIPGLTAETDPAASKENKKTVAAPSAPVKAAPVPVAQPKPIPAPQQPASTEKTGGMFSMFKSQKRTSTPKDSEKKIIDIGAPRQRPAGKPPLASAEDLRKEMAQAKTAACEKDESVLVAKRDLLVNAHPGNRQMEFNELRPLAVRVHPSVAPRQTEDDPRNTAILSDIVEDPGLVTQASGVEKVFQSRQFIEAMRRSVNSSKAGVENGKSPDRYIKPVVPDRPISPMQDNISSVMFLPSPSGICETCGLYTTSCICATVQRVSRNNAPNRNMLDRLLARMNPPRDDPDDERATTNSIKSMNVSRTKAGF
jgi:hypothetical protein